MTETELEDDPKVEYQLAKYIDGAADENEEGTGPFQMLTKTEFEVLSEFLVIYRGNHGCTTPINQFICSLRYHSKHPLKPAYIQRELDQAKEDFEDAVRDAKKLQTDYPELFIESPEIATVAKI